MKAECEIGGVLACQVQECSYNTKRECQAGNIQVGDGNHPACDTFTMESVQQQQNNSMIDTCKMTNCKYSDGVKNCQAQGISLGHHQQHADCDTFIPMG